MTPSQLRREMKKVKPLRTMREFYSAYDPDAPQKFWLPLVTVHGRFQPPLHINHFYTYLAHAFRIAKKVRILITNPTLDEQRREEALHRHTRENNPFTYDERVKIFRAVFTRLGIPPSRYEFKPFDITHENSWNKTLKKSVPNFLNTYSAWSDAKLKRFQEKGFRVIHANIPKICNVSGEQIRKILFSSLSLKQKKQKLLAAGYLKEALPALFKIYGKREEIVCPIF